MFVQVDEKVRRELRAHQTEAVHAARAELAESARTNVVMACGSGKTLVGLRLAEGATRVLQLVPSLALIRQALEQARQDGLLVDRRIICVCCDPTVAGSDSWRVSDKELGVPVTTDPDTLRAKLREAGDRCVVFCTYHSQPLLRDCLPPGFEFELGVFDEAHRTAGAHERAFSVALTDEGIAIRKRLFLTATPRLFMASEDDGSGATYSMDDESIYGKRSYELTLGDAIARGIVCDYQVLTACATGADVQAALNRAHELLLPQRKLPLELVAGQIAVVRAMQHSGARRVVTFHRTIDEAAHFARDRLKIYQNAGVVAFHIHGDMPARQRQAVIDAFLSVDYPTVLTNARCLTEGVDVPDIDMVCFMMRKESLIDVVQATGRALRMRPGKTRGYVMLPLFLDESEPLEQALERSDMAVTWEILHAVLESDGVLAQKLINHPFGVVPGDLASTGGNRGRGKLRVVAPEELLGELERSISMRVISRLSERWDVMVELAIAFSRREGNLDVPVDHVEQNRPLGRWIKRQRFLHSKGRLAPLRAARLTALGMIWRPAAMRWEEKVGQLRQFIAAHGHTRLPPEPEYEELRRWVAQVRSTAAQEKMARTRIDELNSIGFTWAATQDRFQYYLGLYRKWRAENTELSPSRRGPDSALHYFLADCLKRYRRGDLAPAIVEELAAAGYDLRQARRKALTGYQRFGERSWDIHFQALKAYLEHGNWSGLWAEARNSNLNLRSWVSCQRQQKRRAALSTECIAALESLGMEWTPKSEWWAATVRELAEFRAKHGHQRLPTTREYARLRKRVGGLRARLKQGTLSAALVEKLQSIGFARNTDDEFWESNVKALEDWIGKQGVGALNRSGVPRNLRIFLIRRRREHEAGELSDEKLAKLCSLGVPWAALDGLHAQMMARLAKLARQVGKANVEVMTQREPDLHGWLQEKLARAARGDLTGEELADLRRFGVDVGEPRADHERQRAS